MNVDVVLTANSDWLIRLMRRIGVKIYWTHALIKIDFRDEVPVSEGVEFIIEAGSGGVVLKAWRPDLYEAYGVFRLIDEPSEHVYETMLAYAEGQLGKRYMWEALPIIAKKLLKTIFSPFIKKRHIGAEGGFVGTGQVCTSLVDEVFRYKGFDLVPKEESPFVLPDQIAESKLLDLIEEEVHYGKCR